MIMKNELQLPTATQLNLRHVMLNERSQDKGSHAKLNYGGIDYNMVMIEVGEMVAFEGILTEREHKGTLRNAGYIPHLHLGG